jgi:hypothetical protein
MISCLDGLRPTNFASRTFKSTRIAQQPLEPNIKEAPVSGAVPPRGIECQD